MHQVTATEWENAKKFFNEHPNEVKLPWSLTRDGQDRPRFEWFKQYASTHSFIKIKGVIYAMAQGKEDILGRGGSGLVKYLLDEQGGLSVVKIELNPPPIEQKVLRARGQTTGQMMRHRSGKPQKYYTQMTYLGEILQHHMDNNQLSEDRRFELAIELCRLLHRLHRGLDHDNHLACSHGDIKPTNITLDKNGKLHLIDFGSSREYPLTLNIGHVPGSFCYSPPLSRQFTPLDYDVIALQRCLWLPDQLVDRLGPRQFMASNAVGLSLLSADMMNQHDLHPWINTSSHHRSSAQDFLNHKSSPLILAALLINARNQLGLDNYSLSQNAFLCLTLLDLHQQGKHAEDMREHVLTIRESTPVSQALYIKQQLQLRINEDMVSENAALLLRLANINMAAWLRVLCGHPRLVQELLQRDDNSPFNQAVYHLLRYDESALTLASCFERLCDNPDLVNKESALALYDQIRRFHPDTLVALHADPVRMAAINRKRAIKRSLRDFDLDESLYGSVADNEALCDLIIDDQQVNPYFFHFLERIAGFGVHNRDKRQNALLQFMRCRLPDAQMMRYLPEILNNVNALEAVDALYRLEYINPLWLKKIGSPTKRGSARAHIAVIRYLADNHAPPELYVSSMALLRNLSFDSTIVRNLTVNPELIEVMTRLITHNHQDHIEPLLRREWQEELGLFHEILCARDWPAALFLMIAQSADVLYSSDIGLRDQDDIVHAIEALQTQGLTPTREDFNTIIADRDHRTALAINHRAGIAVGALETNPDLLAYFGSIRESIGQIDRKDRLNKFVLLTPGQTEMTRMGIKLCDELEILIEQRDLLQRRGELAATAAATTMIHVIERGIDQHVLEPNVSQHSLENRYASLRASVLAAYSGATKRNLTQHRGGMAIVDGLLSVFSCICRPESAENTRYTFFQPRTAELVDAVLAACSVNNEVGADSITVRGTGHPNR